MSLYNLDPQLFHTYTTLTVADSDLRTFAEGLMDGRLALSPHPEVVIGVDVQWGIDPLDDANWQFQFHSLVWLDLLRHAALKCDEPLWMARYEELLRSWIDNNAPESSESTYAWFDMAVGLRAVVLAFALRHFGPQDWVLSALAAHGEHLLDDRHYNARSNHGLHQDLGLVVVGVALGKRHFIERAYERFVQMFEGAVDDEGVTREGCIDYQRRNLLWYGEGIRRFVGAGVEGADRLKNRLSLMPEFLVHATNPSGRFAMLGDTLEGESAPDAIPAAREACGDGARPLARAYSAGYIFSRSAWRSFEEDSSIGYFTQRFGPGRTYAIHGHEDAGSVTLDAFGTCLLRDSGLYAYEAGEERLYFRGRTAHNVVDVPGRYYYPSAEAELLASELEGGRVFSSISIKGLQGVSWVRSLVWLHQWGVLLVDDRVRLDVPDRVHQLWQLPAGASITSSARETRVDLPEASLAFHQFVDSDAVGVLNGSRAPLGGWYSGRYREMTPAPALQFVKSGDSVRFSTAIVYGRGALTSVDFLGRTSSVLKVALDGTAGKAVVSLGSRNYAVAVS